MADEVKPTNWGRVRPWDGSKGCPPVAVGKLCSPYRYETWLGVEGGYYGRFWHWQDEITAYRIPAAFDHLDDNPADPFAGYTSAELRAAADAKDAADDPLKPWVDLWQAALKVYFANRVEHAADRRAAARTIRDGAAKRLGVTL